MTNYRTIVDPCNKLQTLVDKTIDDQVFVRACVRVHVLMYDKIYGIKRTDVVCV